MATSYYPNDVPTTQTLRRLLETHRKVWSDAHSRVVEVAIDGKVLLVLPDSYHAHLQRFVWREEAIRLVLAHEEELELSEDFVDNITMFMWYMDNVFKRMMIESGPKVKKAESSYHSPTFDNYLLVEHCVRRHEPVNVRAWRRTTDVPFEDFNVHECGECRFPYECHAFADVA